MMFKDDYVNDMEYVDTPDEEGRTALDRACEQNLVDIAKGIYPRYASSNLNQARIENLRENARERGFMKIVQMFEEEGSGQVEEIE